MEIDTLQDEAQDHWSRPVQSATPDKWEEADKVAHAPLLTRMGFSSQMRNSGSQRQMSTPYPVLVPKYEPLHTRMANPLGFLNAFLCLIASKFSVSNHSSTMAEPNLNECTSLDHAVLWSAGIEVTDISYSTMAWNASTKQPVIIDYDLAHPENQPPEDDLQTKAWGGSWIFMPLDILEAEKAGQKRPYPRLYRQTFESFVAVLIWTILRYPTGRPGRRYLEHWIERLSGKPITPEHIIFKRMSEYFLYVVDGDFMGYRCPVVENLPNGMLEGLISAIDTAQDVSGEVKKLAERKQRAPEKWTARDEERLQWYNEVEYFVAISDNGLFDVPHTEGPQYAKLMRKHAETLGYT